MSLEKYSKKRNFDKTTEPKSGKNTEKGKLKFVVQRHHASHLHYDFRLEMDGVLKSWAIPKGPSLNPKDKRLAMMVEDHPYDYRTFEGIIPAGQYGGGVVHIFDEGTYEALAGGTEKDLKKGLQAGNLKFSMSGRILRGEFALIRLKNAEDNAWLLVKHKDNYAVDTKYSSEDYVPEKLKEEGVIFKNEATTAGKQKKLSPAPVNEPLQETKDETLTETKKGNTLKVKGGRGRVEDGAGKEAERTVVSYRPMLARLSEKVFDNPDWIYEKKFDGYRALAYISAKGEAQLISRNGIDFSTKYVDITSALKELCLDAVLDGELVVENNEGKSDFQQLQNYALLDKKMNIKFYVFDLLSLNGHDIREMELIRRKELLEKIIEGLKSSWIVYSAHTIEKGKALYKKAAEGGWEGIIAKNGKSAYLSNLRSDNWLKFKFQNSQEAVVIGFLSPGGSRQYFGSLALGMYKGTELVYIGNCGTGFNALTLKTVYEAMEPLITDRKPVNEKIHKEQHVTWLKPDLVCEVTYAEWTSDGHLRHAVFKGLRIDKEKQEIVKEAVEAQTAGQSVPALEGPDDREIIFGKKTVKLTHLNKLYWKTEGISKGQMINYYEEVGDYMLPYLKDRPLSLNRHPNGIDSPGFFQKDLDMDKVPGWIKSAPVIAESTGKTVDYLICNDKATLLWMANLGCIEINPWLSTYQKPKNPTFAVMDLDPHDINFTEVVNVAQTIKKALDVMKIEGFIKTSGSKGLHIFIPIGLSFDYDISKNFVHYLGQIVLEEHPETTSLERTPSKRKNKIYLDFLQNRRGQTIAAPYSLRPKPGATVSAPLAWDEIDENLSLKNYTIFNMAARIKEKGDLWKDIFNTKNDLIKGLKLWKGG